MSSRLKLAGICFAVAIGLAACGGGGGSPLDAARAERDRLAEQLAQVIEERDTAREEVTTLTGQLEMANQDLMDKQGELDAANGKVSQLEGELGDANQDLMDKQAEVDRLIGNQDVAAIRAKDPADRTQSERQLLDAVDARDMAQGDVTRLEGELGDANGDVNRLEGELRTANGRVRELEGDLRAANSVSGLFQTAASTYNAGAAAVADAGQAVKDATKYANMLSAQAVNGESATAVENAENVLEAETAANNAVMAAEQALADAEAAKTMAMGLADSATKDALIAALEAAIDDATDKVASAKMARDENPLQADGTTPTTEIDSLKEATETVKGNNPLLEGYPTMPAAHGKAVADTVKAAFESITAGSTDAAPMHATMMNDGSGIDAMTWAMIVGEANVMDVRRFATDAISEVKAMSVMGRMGSDLLATGASLPTDDADTDTAGIQRPDGESFDAMYKGIDGTVFCAGTDCALIGGELTGSWYFTPDSTTLLYVADPDMAGSHTPAAMFARYGYWLTFGADGAATGIHTVATVGNTADDTGTDTNTADLNLIRPATATADVTARYSGKAAGISVRGDNSGHFTANVSLTATFGEAVANSMVSGSISGFSGGDHTSSAWRVTLDDATLADTGAGSGIAYGGTAQGAWTTQGYGPGPVDPDGDGPMTAQNQRPAGFFGTFNANFHDGMAAGAYATTAD